MLLDQIQKANDIKNINPKDYPALASEIRDFLVRKISVTGSGIQSRGCGAYHGSSSVIESAG